MKRIFPLLLAALLFGCNEIKDLGHYWDDAKPDPMLVGQWRSESDDIFEFIPSGRDLLLRQNTPTNAVSKATFLLYFQTEEVSVRSLPIKGHTFLLIKRPNGSGALCRYVVSSNQLAFSRLRDSIIEKGIRANIVQGEIPDRIPYDPEKASVPNPLTAFQTCQVSLLNSKTMEFLTSEDNADYWDALRTYKKE